MQGKKIYQEKLFNSFLLSDRVPKDNFYYRLKESLDLHFLYSLTSEFYGKSGQKSIDPVVFFKICLVGYLENIPSDRKLISHSSMRLDILYFLDYDIEEELPWHSTISRTRQLFPEKVFEEVFNKVLHMCISNKMVSGHTQAIDSAPVKANASMESLELKVLQESPEDYLERVKKLNPTTRAGIDKEKLDKKQDKNTEEKQPKISATKEKEKKKAANNKTHYNPHDPDARISVKPGRAINLNYLCSLSVDTAEHVITDVKAYHADRKDSSCLQDIVIRTKSRLWRKGILWKNVLADTNYSSGDNYSFLEKNGLESYIPPHGLYKGGPKNFSYVKKGNYWLCPQGKKAVYKRTDKTKGALNNVYRTSSSDCRDCPIKERCIGKAASKQIRITAYHEEYQRNIARINSEHGRYMKVKRHSTVEPVFGTLKEHVGLKKVLTKGIEEANKGMHMAAIAYNLKKLLKFINNKTKSGANANHHTIINFYNALKVQIGAIRALLSAETFKTYLIKRSLEMT